LEKQALHENQICPFSEFTHVILYMLVDLSSNAPSSTGLAPASRFSDLPMVLCSILSDIRISTRCNLRPERKADAAAAAAATAGATTPAAAACCGCCLPLKNY
jgi:hypothetical protein